MKCTCISGVGNTGIPDCQVAFDVVKQLIFVPYFKEDGTVNGIDLSSITVIDQAFLDSKFKALNPDDRWYPTPELKNIADVRGDDIVETFEDASTAFIQEGPRTFNGLVIGASPQFKGQLDSWRCKKIGYFGIDKSGNLIGDGAVDGVLRPRRLQDNSLSIGFVKTTDTTIQKISISFTEDQLMDDANLSMIESANITGTLLGAVGLLDAVAVLPATGIADTGFTVKLNTKYGSALSKTPAVGLEVADFEVFNVTASSSITPTSVTESPDGTYVFVYTAVTAGDVIRVSNKTSGELDKGYDVKTFEVVTP